MRWLALLLLLPIASAQHIVAVVPDLSGPGPGDEGFAIAGGDLEGWSITDGEDTFHFPPVDATAPTWFAGDPARWAARDGPPAIAMDLRLGNDGDDLRLIDPMGRIADTFFYGDRQPAGWGDLGTPSSDLVYQRIQRGGFVDTDTAADWQTPRPHRMGESDHPPTRLDADAVTTYIGPDATHALLSGLVDAARERLHLHVYELRHQDMAGRLAEAAARGVDVQVLVDARPVSQDPHERSETAAYLHAIEEAGGESFVAGKERYRFHHLKVLVADDAVAIQSENWVASGIPIDPSWGNRGWGVILHGQAIADHIAALLEADRAAWDTTRFELAVYDPGHTPPPDFGVPRGDHRAWATAQRFEGPIAVLPVITPEHTADPARDPTRQAADTAQHRVWAQQLDLGNTWSNVLGWQTEDPLVTALMDAGGRGVDARVMAAAPFRSDDTGNIEAMQRLGGHGVATCTFAVPGLVLHNKGLIADDTVYVGSMNGNHHSRAMNRELGVLIDDARVATYFADAFESDWASCGPAQVVPLGPIPLLVGLMVAVRRCCLPSP